MSVDLYIRDPLGERHFQTPDFPLSVGGDGAVVRVSAGEHGAMAYLGLHEDEFFIQAVDGAPVLHNGLPVKSSAWLKAGDVVTAGLARLRLVNEGGRNLLLVEDGSAGNITAPPLVDPSASRSGGSEGGEDERIEPIAFRRDPGPQAERSRFNPRGAVIAGLAVVFASALWFVFTSVSLVVDVEPGADRVEIDGRWPAFSLGTQFLLRPGAYELAVEREGYRPLVRDIEVTDQSSQRVQVALEKLPGVLRVEVPGEARVSIDGEARGTAPGEFELAPGPHTVVLNVARYREFTREIEIEGGGVVQTLTPELTPAWAQVTVTSEPVGAELFVDGERRGVTPLTTEVLEGSHPLELRLAGYRPWTSDLRVNANEPQTVGPVRLGLPDGRLVIRSSPSGASVTIGGAYRGQTPLELDVRPDITQSVVLARPGYETLERSVAVASGARQVLDLSLAGIFGEVTVRAQPADAQLFVDGTARGAASQTLRLPATTHTLEVRMPGYVTHRVEVTPRPGLPQAIDVTLLTPDEARLAALAPVISSRAGELKLMPVGRFTMGSPRREPGRRANEAQREVELVRRFYLGVREVTNAEYRQFRADHRSGFVGAHSLDLDRQPVANVSWQQAAAFCNWLSAQEGLPPAYEMRGGSLVPVAPATTGYRLPTEAEWEWAARFEGGSATRRYPWGEALPVAPRSGNYADFSARVIVQDVIPDYDDAYPAAAPVGSFPANALGLFDMGGNVAEWTQDLYTVTVDASQLAVDPLGTGDSGPRVIRGSGWRHSGVTDLRLAARDFGNGARTDLGFRIARYAE